MDPLTVGLGVAAGAVTLVVAPYAVLPILGFTKAGVAAGSIAAGVQAGIGNVAAGSAFAAAQSAGVVGFSGAVTAGLGVVGSAIGGAVGGAVAAFFG